MAGPENNTPNLAFFAIVNRSAESVLNTTNQTYALVTTTAVMGSFTPRYLTEVATGGLAYKTAGAPYRVASGRKDRVVHFCENKRDCRRVEILRYFGERVDKIDCQRTCDNCKAAGRFVLRDYTKFAVAALQLIKANRRMTMGRVRGCTFGEEVVKVNGALAGRRDDSSQCVGTAGVMVDIRAGTGIVEQGQK